MYYLKNAFNCRCNLMILGKFYFFLIVILFPRFVYFLILYFSIFIKAQISTSLDILIAIRIFLFVIPFPSKKDFLGKIGLIIFFKIAHNNHYSLLTWLFRFIRLEFFGQSHLIISLVMKWSHLNELFLLFINYIFLYNSCQKLNSKRKNFLIKLKKFILADLFNTLALFYLTIFYQSIFFI